MSRTSLIVSFENEDIVDEPVEMVPASSVDNISTLNEIEAGLDKAEDIHEDILTIESYLNLLQNSDYDLSQEAYTAVLIGVESIYQKHGMAHELTSFESYSSQRELAKSLEGFGGAIYDAIKRRVVDFVDLVRRNVKSTRAEKKRLIQRLKDIEAGLKDSKIKKEGLIKRKSYGSLFSASSKSLTRESDIIDLINNTTDTLNLLGDYRQHIAFCEKLLEDRAETIDIFKVLTGVGLDKAKRSYDIDMSPFFKKLLTEKATRDVVGDFFVKNRNGAGKASKTVIGAHTAYYVSSTPRWFDWVILLNDDNYKFGVYDNKGEGDGEVPLLEDPLPIVKKYREALEKSLGYENAADDNKIIDSLSDFIKWMQDGYSGAVSPGIVELFKATNGIPVSALSFINPAGSGTVLSPFGILRAITKFLNRYSEYICEMMKSPAVQLNSRIVTESATLVRYFEEHLSEND